MKYPFAENNPVYNCPVFWDTVNRAEFNSVAHA